MLVAGWKTGIQAMDSEVLDDEVDLSQNEQKPESMGTNRTCGIKTIRARSMEAEQVYRIAKTKECEIWTRLECSIKDGLHHAELPRVQ